MRQSVGGNALPEPSTNRLTFLMVKKTMEKVKVQSTDPPRSLKAHCHDPDCFI